ncbi:MAG: PIN/TRAM domain-containing protein [Cyanobacteria bacterium WB6_1B_304]|jgi:uncharacterized protein YacL|nr:PIN/TRAM domain-containing protein [Cyanobacteria bacterium WB6_1B_304]
MLNAIIIISFIFTLAGMGYYGIELLPVSILEQVNNLDGLRAVTAGSGALLGGLLGYIAKTMYERLESGVRQMPVDILFSRAVGLVLGLLVANLMLAPIFLLPIPWEFAFIKPLAAVMGSLMFSISGVTLADTHGRALLRLINPNSVETLLVAEGTMKPASAKILDTSSVIDGRVVELLNTGFLEGQVLVPQFVLQELQRIADAPNDQKRIRGRRGLDVLNQIKDTYPDRIVIHPADYDDITTVDAKLVRLAQDINGTLITNDFNLNKVASFQKVLVLNINELAQVLRPSYLPGDNIDIRIVKQGKEPAQGVGYLDDGTMVVVEDGGGYIGNEVRVMVTGALQTTAGRMIFARPQATVTV